AFWSPFNSVPSPDGTKIYFVADSADGIGVFSVAAMNGTAAVLKVGDPFTSPGGIQISSDGSTLFIVALGAEDDSMMMMKQGRIFSMSTAGGTPNPITAADGTAPRGIDAVKMGSTDVLYFTGRETDGSAALFKMNADGSMKSTVIKGDPFTDLLG